MDDFMKFIKELQKKISSLPEDQFTLSELLILEVLARFVEYENEFKRRMEMRYKSYLLSLCERLELDTDEIAKEMDAIDDDIRKNWEEISQSLWDHETIERQLNEIGREIKAKKKKRKKKKRNDNS